VNFRWNGLGAPSADACGAHGRLRRDSSDRPAEAIRRVGDKYQFVARAVGRRQGGLTGQDPATPSAVGRSGRPRCLDAAVDEGVAAFPCRLDDADCSQAIGHLLGEPALDRGCLGKHE
jgi:hypothetical protein